MLKKKIDSLPREMADFLHLAARISDEKKIAAYIVGGFVRDLFLGVDNFDIDLVVEADAIVFARGLAERLGLHIVCHKRFGTATLYGLGHFKVDITTARRESYERPAALPVVKSGSIRDDLFRRDFTINAMAICINAHRYGELIDYYGGLEDLKKKRISALHPESFVHDPTRIMRAVRFEQRFGFSLELLTRGWMKNALKKEMLLKVQKHRIRDELVLMFKEADPARCLKRVASLCGLSFIVPHFILDRYVGVHFAKIKEARYWFQEKFAHRRCPELYMMYMAWFFLPLTTKAMKKMICDFAFHKQERLVVLNFRQHVRFIRRSLRRPVVSASRIYRLLEPLGYEVTLLILASAGEKKVRDRIKEFFLKHHGTRLHIKGEDLKKMGLKPGPEFKAILEQVLFSKIDRGFKSIEEELVLAERLVRRKGFSA